MTEPEDATEELSLAKLPGEVVIVFAQVNAPARLRAHLILVHDVARQLLAKLQKKWPELAVDRDAVLFGAATHDIGKAEHRAELSAPGGAHEEAGYQTLLRLGFPEARARFARTHALWSRDDALVLEDLLVSLADTCWKGKRSDALENLVVKRLAQANKCPTWDVFVWLDDVVTRICDSADARLAWQAQFSTER